VRTIKWKTSNRLHGRKPAPPTPRLASTRSPDEDGLDPPTPRTFGVCQHGPARIPGCACCALRILVD